MFYSDGCYVWRSYELIRISHWRCVCGTADANESMHLTLWGTRILPAMEYYIHSHAEFPLARQINKQPNHFKRQEARRLDVIQLMVRYANICATWKHGNNIEIFGAHANTKHLPNTIICRTLIFAVRRVRMKVQSNMKLWRLLLALFQQRSISNMYRGYFHPKRWLVIWNFFGC